MATTFKKQINSSRNSLRNVSRSIINPKTNSNITIVENVDGALFHDIFEIVQKYLPNGDVVDVHSINEYKNTYNYLTDDGLSGFAITKNGDLISVFNLDKSKKGFLSAISSIVKENAKTLDCYVSPNQNLVIQYLKDKDLTI